MTESATDPAAGAGPPSERSGADPYARSAVRLGRYSFADGTRAAELLGSDPLNWWDVVANEPTSDAAAVVIAALGRSADPDGALDALADIVAADEGGELRSAIEQDGDLRTRVVTVLGVSSELATHLRTHPADWRVLAGPLDPAGARSRLAAAVGADAHDPVTGTSGTRARVSGHEAVTALRDAYRREVLAIAGHDLAGNLDLRLVTERLADLAGHVLQAALAVAATDLTADCAPCRLAVIAMGKTGSRELNYVSDVDVMFVAEPMDTDTDAATDTETDVDADAAIATATRLAGETMRLCRAAAWQVDANLRPEGTDGALVRTLASYEAYYDRWASTWEFQALLKARPVAGDSELGSVFCDAVAPLVWTAAERPGFVDGVRAMRRRVIEHIPPALAERDIKLGRGGLRDVEFAVQLLQLVHGRGDASLQVAETLSALEALRDGGYVGRDDAVSLIDAYRFLRATEHRLQLRRLSRTHVLPDDPEQLLWLAKSLGFRPDRRGDALAVFRAEWQLHAREVRRLHEKLFYRPLLEAVAKVPSAGLRLTTDAAGRRLAALGFADPSAALRHIESLTEGLSRRSALQRALLPVLLDEIADAPDPDAGLLAYRRISEALGTTPWYLRMLRDGDEVVSRLAYVLGVSRYVPRMLTRVPDALRLLASPEDMQLQGRTDLLRAMRDSANRHDDPGEAVAALRGVRRYELLRTAFADLLGDSDVERVCASLAATMEATLETTLAVAIRAVARERGVDELPIRFAIIAMGRLGGAETGYGSDADVMFVHENNGTSEEDANRIAHDVASRVRALLGSASASDPPLALDAGLRPEGRSGALVRSLASYERYYARWSSAWEAQALLRARPVAGDAGLGLRFVEMIDPVRYPDGGVSPQDLLEIRRLKGRIDSERLPRGADPTTHTKLGRGGLTDIEWTIQLLQLDRGHNVPGLRTTRTLAALDAACAAGLIGAQQRATLVHAWQFATRVRNALMLVRDKPADQLPTMGTDLAAVARVLGYPADRDPGELIDDYRRAARRARKVVETVFYDS